MAATSPFWRILFVLHLGLLLLAYFFAAVNPFWTPGSWPLANLVALGAPYVLAYAVVYFILLSIQRKRWTWLLFTLPALLWLTNIIAVGKWLKPAEGRALRVMSFNIQSFQEIAEYAGYPNKQRAAFVRFLQEQKPDIICFQEFTESGEPYLNSNLGLLKNLGYTHFGFPVDSVQQYPQFSIRYGTLVASKFPVTGQQIVRYRHQGADGGEGVSKITLRLPDGPLTVINLHLSSMSLSVPRDNSRGISNLKKLATDVKQSRTEIFRRIIQYSYLHEKEANIIRSVTDSVNGRLIVCGDMNNVPNSYAYRHIKSSLQDAFARSGFGLGKSYKTGLPTIRIDYILCSNDFKPVSHKSLPTPFSDHFAQVAELMIKPPKP